MVTLSIKDILVGILLIALIALVIYLIVMVGKITDLLKGANAILEGGERAAVSAKEGAQAKLAEIREKTAPVKKLLGKGYDLVAGIIDKLVK